MANKNYDVIMSSYSTAVNKYSNHETSTILFLVKFKTLHIRKFSISISVRFSRLFLQRMYFLFGCHGLLCLPVMLLPAIDASPYISFIMGWEAPLAGRSTITCMMGRRSGCTRGGERLSTTKNQF